ncbi:MULTISPECIES: pyridoxamine 5'-phosphate oxidase family protein [unclassified Streptomyces]|uniref:pyridoxamine 5'-phosphate oxidase family protein n=1 Tax=unclassified Streptomyces TaxID=2593676 RepID=UPI00226F1251|nr:MULTISPECIES: pyridoxamine 5'-phosphate oxidase family protein [unclassified Streptomyces]MCY0922364.1 pyridoxamine 5'-phosphate oxidase family protein [Streptomyces sp. H27-G5]MCY0956739.1 pyridoxamine 5'-phosphate oxidase family protein [Streptomyces sp. H27-H5]
MTVLDSAPLDALDAYRTCEFVTLGRNGTPQAWPTAVARREDGTLLLTTSLAFAQKALNVRRDGRVALLFSDPTGSGLDPAPQVFVAGRAECPDEIMTGPEGAEAYWQRLFERQPHSRSYLSPPMRPLMHWYYLRLHITVEPEHVRVRPPLATLPEPGAPAAVTGTEALPGAVQLSRFSTAVLAARDASGAPLLARTRPRPTPAGYLVDVPSDCAVQRGPATLLVHRHDERLNHMYNASVRGDLRRTTDGWILVPAAVVEPMGSGRATDAFRVLRHTKRSTNRYLERRGLSRPQVRWDRFRALARAAAHGEPTA